ncbi:MAG: Co2+/Mg2+ efflux protein ApaG [Pseudomonadota bacterium]
MIKIDVQTKYVDGQSEPDKDRYVFAYTITITNELEVACQLLSRHWIITDASGDIEEVEGEGVVGQQPSLQPGESFQYTSGAVLKTPVGSMHGEYHFEDVNGHSFSAPIPAFSLSVPNLVH